jgi:hypothetical protein
MSPESQLRLSLSGIAVILFLIAGFILSSGGAVSAGLAWLSFGLAAIAGCLMVPPAPVTNGASR